MHSLLSSVPQASDVSPETAEVSVKSQLPGSLFSENPQHSVESAFRSQAAESVAVSAPLLGVFMPTVPGHSLQK